MRIAKPLLLVMTPVGLAAGIYEAWQMAGGLVFLLIALVAGFGAALASVVAMIRREERARPSAGAAAAIQEGGKP